MELKMRWILSILYLSIIWQTIGCTTEKSKDVADDLTAVEQSKNNNVDLTTIEESEVGAGDLTTVEESKDNTADSTAPVESKDSNADSTTPEKSKDNSINLIKNEEIKDAGANLTTIEEVKDTGEDLTTIEEAQNTDADLATNEEIKGTGADVTSTEQTPVLSEEACTCVNLNSCPLEAFSEQTCDNALEVCCFEPITENNTDIFGINNECTCVSSEECVGLGSEVIQGAKYTCLRTNQVCCSFNHSIDDFLKNILNNTIIIPEGDNITTQECTCVVQNQCNTFNFDAEASECNFGEICCPYDQVDLVNTTGLPIEPLPPCACVSTSSCEENDIISDVCEVEGNVCCENHRPSCGHSHVTNFKIDVRTKYGYQAKFAEFPWMVAISEEENGRINYTCGGSLLHPEVVLTSGHCINKNPNISMRIRAGDLFIGATSEQYPHQDRLVTRQVLHPNYTKETSEYNFGLLILDKPVEMKYHINTICLPNETDEHTSDCTVSGWGRTNFGHVSQFQSTLKKVDVLYVDNSDCEETLRINGAENFNLTSTHVCGGRVRGNPCNGDEGSPMVCSMIDGSNRFVQIGSVSKVIECDQIDMPGVFSSTKSAVSWIREYMIQEFGAQSLEYFT